ncbi:MAG: hypothetical protein WD058_08845, partial [Dehalococcoidia bacterium]
TPGGDTARVTLPPGALPPGTPTGVTLELGVVADLGALAGQAPLSPEGLALASFLTRLTDPDGEPVGGTLTPPGSVTLTVTPETLGDTPPETLVLVRLTPVGWVEAPSAVEVGADGSVTLVAPLTEMPAVLAVVAAPDWGTFTAPVFPSGLSLTIWAGGGYDRLDAVLGADRAAWVTVGGQWFGYIPGAPPFVNAPFIARFPDGLPAMIPVSVVN